MRVDGRGGVRYLAIVLNLIFEAGERFEYLLALIDDFGVCLDIYGSVDIVNGGCLGQRGNVSSVNLRRGLVKGELTRITGHRWRALDQAKEFLSPVL